MMKKSKFKKIAAIACAMALTGTLAFAVTACDNNKGGGSEGPGISQGAIELDKSTDTVKVGKTTTIQVTTATTSNIIWTSSAPDVATVAGSGNGNKIATITGVAQGTATIKAKAGNYEATCTVTVEAAEVLTPVDVTFSPQNDFASGWRYWTGDGTATVSSCKTYAEKSDVTINYNFTSGLSYSVQLFYKDFKTTDVEHDVTLTVVSDVKDNITINNQKVELEEGENKNITITGYSGSTLVINFGVWDENIVSGTHEFTFKDIVATPKAGIVELKAPSLSITDGEGSTKVVKITDTENTSGNIEKYELGVFENATDDMPKYTVKVTDDSVLKMPKVPTGNYVVKLRAYNSSSNVLSSPWSETSVNLAWTNPTTPLEYKEEANIAAGSNTWYMWNRTWGGPGEECTYEACYMDGNTIYVEGLNSKCMNNWDFQLFYRGTAGKKLNITVTAQNAGYITVKGDVRLLEAGKAEVFENIDATTIGIQFGGSDKTLNLQGDITLEIEDVTAQS